MEERGMSALRFKVKRDIVRCPKCGYRFSVSYSRAFACSGCYMASFKCDYVKCPNCGYEFMVKG
jgi:DNA-directed RNA polymerase subunit RPC12/RpoP